MAVEECILYTSWPSSLTGYPTVLDCRPRKKARPVEALLDAYTYLSMLVHSTEKPVRQSPELIGGRYLVYNAVSTAGSKPLIEARSVYDRKTSMTIWAGGVMQALIPGAPRRPAVQPSLPVPESVEPPQAPEGQKTIRKPVVYSAEGGFPRHRGVIRLGTYDESGFNPMGEVRVEDLDGEWVERDFHCVTGWSVRRVKWRLTRLDALLTNHRLTGKWLLAVSSGGYTASIPLEPYILEEAYIATGLAGAPLPREHGGPARLVLPRLYGWKSVKWITGLYTSDLYLDGYWEARGYHWRGLVSANERFKLRVE